VFSGFRGAWSVKRPLWLGGRGEDATGSIARGCGVVKDVVQDKSLQQSHAGCVGHGGFALRAPLR